MLLFDKKPEHCNVNHADLFLHHLSAQNLVNRLCLVKRSFKKALIMGGGAQHLVNYLALQGCAVFTNEQYSGAQQIRFYEESFPFTWPSFDLVCCNLNLHWVSDLPGVLLQIRYLLYPDGLFLGSFLGQETLKELKESFLRAEINRKRGVGVHIAPMIDLATATHLLQRAGLAIPVADHDKQIVTYLSPLHLMKDLKLIGETNRSIHRPKSLYPPVLMGDMISYYQENFSQAGRIFATYDFCYLTGWGPDKSQQKPLSPGTATHALFDALAATEKTTPDTF